LPENIEFVAAKTKEEGINFAKNVLGIKYVDDAFTLDAINYVNEGLVQVSNVNKGKCFMPPKLFFEDLGDRSLAHVVPDVKDKNFACMSINKNFFDLDFMKKLAGRMFGDNGAQTSLSSGSEKAAKDVVDAVKKREPDLCLKVETIDLFKKYRQGLLENDLAGLREFLLRFLLDEEASFSRGKLISIIRLASTSRKSVSPSITTFGVP
jgi:hypothetical protein